MKIRNGFVSNSSSSSYVLIGTPLNSVKQLSKAKNPIMIGTYLDSGVDAVKLTEEMINCIVRHNEIPEDCTIYDVIFEGDENSTISRKTFPNDKQYELYSGTVDYHCTETLGDFVEKYYNNKD